MKNNNEQLLNSVSLLIKEARNLVVRNVNTTMVYTYFHIGRMIVEEEQHGKDRAAYSESVLKELSGHLTKEYGKGFSHRNLEYFRKFYLSYTNRISQSVIAKFQTDNQQVINTQSLNAFSEKFKLSWTHYIQLIKIGNDEERDFYEIESASNNWSVRELQRQFNSSLYERLALSKDKQELKHLSSKGQVIEKPFDTLKTPYVLEFLNLEESSSYTENDLETAIIDKLEHFMMELGKGFLFEGRQKRITLDGDHFYVDLVFYNRLLRCFVLIDLKIGKLAHQDIGQMQMYVNYYDRKVKLPDEKNTIGIVLCKQENKAVVEFTLPLGNDQIFAKEYKLYLPSKEDLKRQLE
ncbi:PDDEXK nuclease domain-containing protein [Pedobacter sp. P351]|uniref:PDDEXK nuclease domain-containing protein n=1 Tax=Pedobacter superstes TaxID=3133441 RepID=UPI00309D7820